jgi:ParB-like chromosome segregation protein Spo0J
MKSSTANTKFLQPAVPQPSNARRKAARGKVRNVDSEAAYCLAGPSVVDEAMIEAMPEATPEAVPEATPLAIHMISVHLIEVPYRPSKAVEAGAVGELAKAIESRAREQEELGGSLQIKPFSLRDGKRGKFILNAEENRFLAARDAGLVEVPVFIQDDAVDSERELASIERLFHGVMNPMDIATCLNSLMIKNGYSVRETAKRVHKDKNWVNQHIMLLDLSWELQSMVRDCPTKRTHALRINRVADAELRARLIAGVRNGSFTSRNIYDFVESIGLISKQLDRYEAKKLYATMFEHKLDLKAVRAALDRHFCDQQAIYELALAA